MKPRPSRTSYLSGVAHTCTLSHILPLEMWVWFCVIVLLWFTTGQKWKNLIARLEKEKESLFFFSRTEVRWEKSYLWSGVSLYKQRHQCWARGPQMRAAPAPLGLTPLLCPNPCSAWRSPLSPRGARPCSCTRNSFPLPSGSLRSSIIKLSQHIRNMFLLPKLKTITFLKSKT